MNVDASAIGSALVHAFGELRAWVAKRQVDQTLLQEKELNAVRAFQTAVVRTSSYVSRIENGEQQHRAQEEELANLWADSALAFYGVNNNITTLLHLKALSWARPAPWIDEEVAKAGITLNEMNELLRNMLEKGHARV